MCTPASRSVSVKAWPNCSMRVYLQAAPWHSSMHMQYGVQGSNYTAVIFSVKSRNSNDRYIHHSVSQLSPLLLAPLHSHTSL